MRKPQANTDAPHSDAETIIHVAFITDKAYAIPTAAACHSIIQNRSPSTLVTIHIVTTGLSQAVRQWLTDIQTPGVEVEIIDLKNDFQHLAQVHPHVSPVALLKFSLPNIFPGLKRVLYLDSDVLVLSDLSELFSTALQDRYAAVVQDMAAISEGHNTKMGHAGYFNSGVMLLNLEKMRQEGIADKLIELKSRKVHRHFMDQDEFNLVFSEDIIDMPPEFNMMRRNYTQDEHRTADFYAQDIEVFRAMYESPTILHLTNTPKIWVTPKGRDYDLWLSYLPAAQLPDYIQSLDDHYSSIIRALKDEVGALTVSKAEAERRRIDAEAEVSAMRHSYSWRITAPLRWAANKLIELCRKC